MIVFVPSKMATRPKTTSRVNTSYSVESSDGENGENDKCGHCKVVITDEDKAAACEVCDTWYHIKCEELPDSVYEYMGTEKGMRKILWYCTYCSRGSVKLHNRVKKIECNQENLSRRQSALEEEVEVMKEGMEKHNSDLMLKQDSLLGEITVMKETAAEDKVNSKAIESRVGDMEAIFVNLQQELESVKVEIKKGKNMEKSYSETLLVEMEKKTEEKCTEVKREMEKDLVNKTANYMQNRMDRRNNIVLHGAPEEIKDNLNLWLRSEKIKHDKAILLELCLEIEVECYMDDITAIRRVGRFKDNRGRVDAEGAPRPIIVTLKEGIKEKILRNVYKLKNTENEMLKRIRVTHDMTQDERQKDSELRLEAKQKNEAETGNFFYVVTGNPWERHILKLKKKGTPKVQNVQQAQAQAEGEKD